MFQIVMI